eukprot:SAG31_NODE_1475_length_8204_cov_18.026280_2_plen_132_part_00
MPLSSRRAGGALPREQTRGIKTVAVIIDRAEGGAGPAASCVAAVAFSHRTVDGSGTGGTKSAVMESLDTVESGSSITGSDDFERKFAAGDMVWVQDADGYTKAEVIAIDSAKQLAEVDILCEVCCGQVIAE